MSQSRLPTVLVLGHSFVRRMADFTREHLEGCKPDFDLPCNVKFLGFSGGLVSHLWSALAQISCISPDIVLLDIGTNDLASPSATPGEIADSVVRFADHLISSCGVKVVHIAQIFRRLEGAPRTPPEFNEKVFAYNAALRSLCRHAQSRTLAIYMFTFRGMSENWATYLNPLDGVHFTVRPSGDLPNSGSYKYYRCLKTCVIFALRMPAFSSAAVSSK
jgi:hypothetical protein